MNAMTHPESLRCSDVDPWLIGDAESRGEAPILVAPAATTLYEALDRARSPVRRSVDLACVAEWMNASQTLVLYAPVALDIKPHRPRDEQLDTLSRRAPTVGAFVAIARQVGVAVEARSFLPAGRAHQANLVERLTDAAYLFYATDQERVRAYQHCYPHEQAK